MGLLGMPEASMGTQFCHQSFEHLLCQSLW